MHSAHQYDPVPGGFSRRYGLQLLWFHMLGAGIGGGLAFLLLWRGWTARETCGLLAGLFFLAGFLRLWTRGPLCIHLPGLRDLYQYERQRMGGAFSLYYRGGGWIFLSLGFLSGLQAWLRSSPVPWREEMPRKYWISIMILVIVIGVVHNQIHQRCVRQWSSERWFRYSHDRQLFLRIWVYLLTGILLGGAILYQWLIHIKVR